jgi:hypothetical protein
MSSSPAWNGWLAPRNTAEAQHKEASQVRNRTIAVPADRIRQESAGIGRNRPQTGRL